MGAAVRVLSRVLPIALGVFCGLLVLDLFGWVGAVVVVVILFAALVAMEARS